MRAFLATLLLCLFACAAHAESGIASVYWEGARTASGERLCTSCLTAAHRTLPFGTLVKVCRIGGSSRHSAAKAGNCIAVRINDRGPFVRGRIIDLTPAGARALGFSGLARVTVEPLGWTPRHGDFGSF
jgi:rare lipoprotein A